MEKGREKCGDSPALNEEWIKEILEDVACGGNIYSEEIVRESADKILIFDVHIMIFKMDGSQVTRSLQNK